MSMYLAVFATLCFLIAAIVIIQGLRVLLRGSWIFAWLRGTLGICMVVLSVILIFTGLDLFSYKRLLEQKPIATLSFEKIDEQLFKSTLVLVDEGTEESFEIHGDQWQMDARVISWLGLFKSMGAKPGFRLDRLSGRYYSLEDERRNTRSVHQLHSREYGIDTWAWLQNYGKFVPWIEAIYGSATFLPMEDGALYQVLLSQNGLTAKPLNEIAAQAINRWH